MGTVPDPTGGDPLGPAPGIEGPPALGTAGARRKPTRLPRPRRVRPGALRPGHLPTLRPRRASPAKMRARAGYPAALSPDPRAGGARGAPGHEGRNAPR